MMKEKTNNPIHLKMQLLSFPEYQSPTFIEVVHVALAHLETEHTITNQEVQVWIGKIRAHPDYAKWQVTCDQIKAMIAVRKQWPHLKACSIFAAMSCANDLRQLWPKLSAKEFKDIWLKMGSDEPRKDGDGQASEGRS